MAYRTSTRVVLKKPAEKAKLYARPMKKSNKEMIDEIISLSKTVGSSGEGRIFKLLETIDDEDFVTVVEATIKLYPYIYRSAGIKGIIRHMEINGDFGFRNKKK